MDRTISRKKRGGDQDMERCRRDPPAADVAGKRGGRAAPFKCTVDGKAVRELKPTMVVRWRCRLPNYALDGVTAWGAEMLSLFLNPTKQKDLRDPAHAGRWISGGNATEFIARTFVLRIWAVGIVDAGSSVESASKRNDQQRNSSAVM